MDTKCVFLLLCAVTMVIGSSIRKKRSPANPLTKSEVSYYLKELSELQDQLTGSTSSRKRDRSSKRRKNKHEEQWRAGKSWWEQKHGKNKKSGRSRSWSSMSFKCDQPLSYGNTDCTEAVVRYYYERESKMCREFHYTGCGGNRNNFRSLSECKQKCKR